MIMDEWKVLPLNNLWDFVVDDFCMFDGRKISDDVEGGMMLRE